jgi:hypothetical protein
VSLFVLNLASPLEIVEPAQRGTEENEDSCGQTQGQGHSLKCSCHGQ